VGRQSKYPAEFSGQAMELVKASLWKAVAQIARHLDQRLVTDEGVVVF
jgi:hypothetical protein